MRQQRPRGPFVFFGLGFAIALMVAMPVIVAADTTTGPISVVVNTSITFSGGGFAPNESLSVWETGPDSTPMPPTGIQTDGSGSFAISVSFPSVGQWQVTAHSIATGQEYVGIYSVGASSAMTAPASNGPPMTGTPVGIGLPVTFSGNGFTANEAISVWETAPDGTPTPLPGIYADNSGAFTDSVTFPTAGQWQVTAHGRASGHEVIAPFAVGTTGSASSLPVTTGVSGGPAFNGTAASVGIPVTFAGTGFNAVETLSFWTTAPDSSVAPLAGAKSDGTGGFTIQVTFPSSGNWQVTAHGHASGHEVIGRYAVTDSSLTATTPSPPSATFTSPFANVLIKATSGVSVTFTATGFSPGEKVAVWTTAPDTTVTTLSSVQASSTGQATVTTTFASAGLWQITLHGRTSAYEVIGRYDVAAPV